MQIQSGGGNPAYRRFRRTVFTGITSAMILCITGCAGMGPQTIPRDRFDYNSAIAESLKNQMLLNIVRLRYADTPVFLDVASVISSYSWESELELDFAFQSSNTQAIGTKGRYTDKPTISYHPLMGEKYTRSLLTPLRPDAISSLIQAGWPVDFVLEISIRAINGIYNNSYGKLMGQQADPEFRQLLQTLRRIEMSNAIGMRIRKDPEGLTSIMFFRKELPEGIVGDVQWVHDKLGITSETQEFSLVFGGISTSDQEIALLTRSMMEIAVELSAGVEVPPEHLASGRTTEVESNPEFPFLIRIHSGKDEPSQPFAAVKNRDHWFWIDDTDFQSKRYFTFVTILFTLAESGGQGAGTPTLTIPAN